MKEGKIWRRKLEWKQTNEEGRIEGKEESGRNSKLKDRPRKHNI